MPDAQLSLFPSTNIPGASFGEDPIEARKPDEGMGMAVARRTVFRKSDQEDWGKVADRVAYGNMSLAYAAGYGDKIEEQRLRNAIASGALLTSGRHLQHGDENQVFRPAEVFTNCSSSITCYAKFLLLLCGSGVGRSYDDELMVVDWAQAPDVLLYLSSEHIDHWVQAPERFAAEFNLSVEHIPSFVAREFITNLPDMPAGSILYRVQDSREGWAKAVEIWESLAYAKDNKYPLVLDFSDVRPCGAPIHGMQERPASGPLSIMRAFMNVRKDVIAAAKINPMPLWEQNLRFDHFFSVEVQVGGARRAARMATKSWKDPGILKFIRIKEEGGLWTANHSIMVDQEFWMAVRDNDAVATKIFDESTRCAYETGEPGFINADKLEDHRTGFARKRAVDYDGSTFKSKMYKTDAAVSLVSKLSQLAVAAKYPVTTNPCQPAFASVLTPEGISDIGSIGVGRIIWSEDGWVTVTNKQCTGVKEVYRYRTTSGVVYCTPEHRIVEQGVKISVKEAESIDRLRGPGCARISWDNQIVMDGLMLGDGSVHMSSYDKVYLTIGKNDQDYFSSELSSFIIGPHAVKYGYAYKVKTSLTPEELPLLPVRTIPGRYMSTSYIEIASLLRGLFSANGSIVVAKNQYRITLKSTSARMVEQVQIMLSALGIESWFTTNKPQKIKWKNGEYISKESYDINIPPRCGERFAETIGFVQKYKNEKLENVIMNYGEFRPNRAKTSYDIRSIDNLGEIEVFDITVSGLSHTYWSGGCNVSNCGEQPLHILGGYCTLADSAPLLACPLPIDEIRDPFSSKHYYNEFSDWDKRVEDALRLAVRFLIRVNQMDCFYSYETKRTNRIGVALTGIHEWAWLRFGIGFIDMLDEGGKAATFWRFVQYLSDVIKEEANTYSDELGLQHPVTVPTIKPSGTTAKVFGITEGAHLPAKRYYLRWVQFRGAKDKGKGEWIRGSDTLLAEYEERGYPLRELITFPGMTIVGFPTAPIIMNLGMGDKIVTAPEATPEQQYEYLRLLEKYWLGEERGSQVSYSLKLYKDQHSLEDFRRIVLDNQPTIRCCAIMPVLPESEMSYEYLPEESVSQEEFDRIVANIKTHESGEHIDMETLRCASGVCPI